MMQPGGGLGQGMGGLPPDIASLLSFNETGAQFFRRVQQERVLTGLPIIDRHVSLRPGVVVEVAGPPGSGKTELLLSVALHVLLAQPYSDLAAWLPRPSPPPATAVPGQGQAVQAPQGQQPYQGPPQQQGREDGHVQGQEGADNPALCPAPAGSGHVVLFDLDGKFDGVRLIGILHEQVGSAWHDMQQQQRLAAQQRQQQRRQQRGTGTAPGPPGAGGGRGGGGGGAGGTWGAEEAPEEEEEVEVQMLSMDEVVSEVLSRLHVVRCHNSMQLLAALAALPARLEEWQAGGSSCRLLLIDNVGSHFWRDKAARNVAPPGASGAAGAPYHQQYQHHQPQQPQHGQQAQRQHGQQQPLPHSLFEVHAAIAARLQHISRRHRLPVLATKAAAVTARGLAEAEEGGGGGGMGLMEGGVAPQLQQREYLPMPWQNVVTHRMLLYPRGVTTAPGTPGNACPQTQGTAQVTQSLTHVLVEMLGPVGAAAVAAAAAAGAGGAGSGGAGGPGGEVGGRGVSRLVISSVALVEWV